MRGDALECRRDWWRSRASPACATPACEEAPRAQPAHLPGPRAGRPPLGRRRDRRGRPRRPLRLRRAVLAEHPRPVQHLARPPAGQRARRRSRRLRPRPLPDRGGARARAPLGAQLARSCARSSGAVGSGPPSSGSRPPCSCAASSRRSPAPRSSGSRSALRTEHQVWAEQPAGGAPVALEHSASGPARWRCRSSSSARTAPPPSASSHRWRIHPAVAHEATGWAVARHREQQRAARPSSSASPLVAVTARPTAALSRRPRRSAGTPCRHRGDW